MVSSAAPERSPRRRSVDLAHVVERALEITDVEGQAALTMRRLAEELGIGVMTLYGHVRTKEELIDLAVDRAMADLVVPSAGSWDKRLTGMFQNLRDVLLAHPTVLYVNAMQPLMGPHALRHADAAIGLWREAGLDGVDAVTAMTLLVDFTWGSAMFLHYSTGPGGGIYERGVRAVDPAQFPHLAAVAPAMMARGQSEEFTTGLRLLIDGLRPPRSRKRR
jgi:AcrR family transcriptional regulator